MTTTPSNWLHSSVVPALVAAVSATWVSAWLDATAHVGHGHPADVPWIAVTLPAVAAVVVASGGQALVTRWVPSRRARQAVRAAMIVVGAALTVGALVAVGAHGGFVTAAFHPWDLRTAVAVGAARLGWFVAVVAWSGGLWLGRREMDRHQAFVIVSAAVGMLGLYFLVAAADPSGAFHRRAATTAVLLVVAFPASGLALALTHERDLERTALRQVGRPSGAWLAALGGPILIVGLLAVAAALVVGPAAPALGRAARDLAVWIAGGVEAFLRLLAFLIGRPVTGTRTPRLPRAGVAGKLRRASPAPWWLEVIGIVVAVGAGIVAVALLVGLGCRIYRWWRARVEPAETATTDEELSSLWSWGHLLAQILGLFGRRWRRPTMVGNDAEGTASLGGASLLPPEPETVRAHYLELLRAARAAGRGRRADETPLELARRLVAPDRRGDDDLAPLTQLYDDVRYGNVREGPDATARAARYATGLCARLAMEATAMEATAMEATAAMAPAGTATASDTTAARPSTPRTRSQPLTRPPPGTRPRPPPAGG